MEGVMGMKGLLGREKAVAETKATQQTQDRSARADGKMSLLDAQIGQTYRIREIDTSDEEMNAFLFRLGCYSGEPITVISKKKKSCIVAIKDSRYGLDNQLAEAVIV